MFQHNVPGATFIPGDTSIPESRVIIRFRRQLIEQCIMCNPMQCNVMQCNAMQKPLGDPMIIF